MIRASAIVLLLLCPLFASAAPVPPPTAEMLKAIREARRAGNLDQAEKLLTDYESRKGDPETVRMEWLLLRAQRGETTAQKELQALLKKKDVDAVPVLEALARGYVADYRPADAQAVLDDWLKRDPKSADAYYLREKPDYAPTHRALADYYEHAGKKDLAEQHRKLAEGKK